MSWLNESSVSCQPCKDFAPNPDEGEFYVHECPGCSGRRYACGNCHRDHHEGGWNMCSRYSKESVCKHPACAAPPNGVTPKEEP